MHTVETAFQPLPSEPAATVAAAVRETAERANDAVYSVFTHVKSVLAQRANTVAEQWDELPRWQRAAYQVGAFVTSTAGAVVAVQAGRMTGAMAHGLEETGLLHSLPMGGGSGASLVANTHATPAEAPQQYEFAPAAHMTTAGHDVGTLPADLDKAPDATPIGDYDSATGEGTIWHQVEVYADKMGYDPNGKQMHEVTAEILDDNNKTWNDARDLDAVYEPKMPSQRTMTTYLEDAGAHRTHTPDRAEVIDSPADNNGSGNGEQDNDLDNDGLINSKDAMPNDSDADNDGLLDGVDPQPAVPLLKPDVDVDVPDDWDRTNLAVAGATILIGAGLGYAAGAGISRARSRRKARRRSASSAPVTAQRFPDAPDSSRSASLADARTDPLIPRAASNGYPAGGLPVAGRQPEGFARAVPFTPDEETARRSEASRKHDDDFVDDNNDGTDDRNQHKPFWPFRRKHNSRRSPSKFPIG